MDRHVIVFLLYILLFLAGMGIMTGGMNMLVGRSMQKTIERASGTPLKGLALGTCASILLQSSSAVTIITVGLIASGAMHFSQSIGIILGANVGTTLTGELAVLPVGQLYLILLGGGLLLMGIPMKKSFSVGSLCFGIGCLFASMAGFSSLAEPLAESSFIGGLLLDAGTSHFYAVLVGTLFSAVIQSSSATMLVCMGFLDHGLIALPSAVAIMFGSNIGTCLTTYLASLGAGKEGRWTAYTHIFFNLLSVALFFPFVDTLSEFSLMLTGNGKAALAHISVVFNLVSALLAVPLAGPYGRWVERHRFK